MPNFTTNRKMPDHVTSGEILGGAIWFGGYCLVMIFQACRATVVTTVNIAGLY